VLKAARDAQRHTPELRTFNRIGEEVYDVDFHPAYHELMSLGFGSGVHSLAWTAEQPGAHSARAVLSYLWNQIDGSTACPLGMAHASIPVLRSQPELAPFARAVQTEGYDPADVPIAEKLAATIGYFMTEKQGGSDLRANVTVARPAGKQLRLPASDRSRPTSPRGWCEGPDGGAGRVQMASPARPPIKARPRA
jgi:putative acyl-CoA dehydrogenase